ncbi:hypothetical protein C8A03DRAFT_33643 [Achaetomium macrosporum]|uniref:Ankyrin repeat protein n=1 Tax=Achaetomium macrosporum TaxID=79813 RepID=A0AAN7CAI4_9PEZI|nr:hypothetical protein C8A03DRAFT_33643 [Achaetomium macrosporum]
MPFLHWDLEDLKSRREIVVEAVVAGREQNLPDVELNIEQKLLKAYLTNHHPLHLHRTLDQYYYHTLADTRKRDADQVVSRHQTFTGLRPRIMTMVDQLWLWVLSGADGQPDTVVTCFPHVGKAGGENDEDDPDPDAFTSVLRRIKLSMLEKSFRVQSAYGLAGLIAATCSRIYLDPGRTLSFQKGRTIFQFAELYETEISNIAQGEAVLFSSFASLKKGDVADISEEIKLLSRIKDVLDELNIMRILFGDQRKVLRTMDGIVKSASDLGEDRQIDTEDEDGASLWSERGEVPEEAWPDDAALSQESKSAKDARLEVDESGSREKQGARYIWGNRGDPDEFSYPLAMVMASLEEIGAMIERAEKAEQALTSMVDLKQNHNSVTDAQESLKQGRTVLVFTLTTTIFLPLSFLASFFTIEISQF